MFKHLLRQQFEGDDAMMQNNVEANEEEDFPASHLCVLAVLF